jgi:hypothetical protein
MLLTRGQQGWGQMNDEERQLWRAGDLECVMISCCAGAELQLRLVGSLEIVMREMYPMKTDLYERARDLRAEYEHKQTHDRK